MEDEKASATATGVALLRVLHQRIDGEPRILEDPVSERLLDPRGVSRALSHLDRFQTPRGRGLRTHVLVRSRFSEEAMASAVGRGVKQIVQLGAGLDTFAHRQPEWARDARIFEVDHPSSQADKRRRLGTAGLPHPPNLTYAPVDFERESLRDGLERAGLDLSGPTFFSCLGVLMYLTGAAAQELFALLGTFPAGSELVLTFSPESDRTDSERRFAEKVASIGEPLRYFVSEAALTENLKHAGFSEVAFLSPAEISSRYLGQRSDGLEPPRRTTMAHARI